MRHNDATGCVTFTQPGYYVLSCLSVFNAHRCGICSSPHTSGLVDERNCRKKSEEQEHTTNTSSTIYGAQSVPTVSRIVVHALLMMQRWIPACAESTPQNAPRIEKKCLGGND